MKHIAFAADLAVTNVSTQSINGVGAIFPYPINSKWFSKFNHIHPEAKINYHSIGSGDGIRQICDGIVDFCAIDSPMSDQEIAAAKAKTKHIPTVLGAVVPAVIYAWQDQEEQWRLYKPGGVSPDTITLTL